MAPESPFIVEVRDLPAHRAIDVPSVMVREALAGLPMREALEAPETAPAGGGKVDLDIYADGSHVFANGKVTGWLEVACSRCVNPVKIPLDEEVRVTFMPRSQLAALSDDDDVPAAKAKDAKAKDAKAKDAKPKDAKAKDAKAKDEPDEGPEVAAEDLDVFPYDGDKVDLEPLVREQFVLAVPYAPLCKDDCAGLCPQCGVDRNLEACACEKPVDPRFAALRGLKLPT